MTDPSGQIEIPNRALFKAAEVCDLLQVQAYVLRSWEAEFPDLGVSKTAGAKGAGSVGPGQTFSEQGARPIEERPLQAGAPQARLRLGGA